jgi:RNA polymerase sigma-70 factor (ECF subfamily)
VTSYHLEAEIAGCHAVATSAAATDWPRILGAYDQLLALTRSPVVALNRVVALREVSGAATAMRELERVAEGGALRRYHTYHGVRADLFEALGSPYEAIASWQEALLLARSGPVRRFIEGRIAGLANPPVVLDVESGDPRPS